MSNDLTHKVDQAADNAWVKIIARISLPVLAFIGTQAWGDLKEQGKILVTALQHQAVMDERIENLTWRMNRLEDAQSHKAKMDQAIIDKPTTKAN